MSDKTYEKLRELIDVHPLGCPPAPEIIEILKILFDEDEARVALGLGFIPFAVDQIARRAGMDPKGAESHLESLADKGVVYAREKNGVKGYALLNVINLFENPYRKGIHDDTINKLTPLWIKYRATLSPHLGGETTSISRVVPIRQKIESKAEILSYEKIDEMIDEAKVVGIARCACREFEQKCDAAREACMVFDATCTYLVERGFARYLTKDEMKQKLKEFDDAGLVRQVNNTRDRLEFVCHCCSCCCRLFATLTEFKNPRVLTKSAFLPVTDPEKCEGCGTCADERCPMGAREMVEGRPVLTVERCIGCGLCSTGCPNDAIRMERSAEVPEPPADYMELGLRLLQEKGKLEEFIRVNTV
jgi:ferredoxin/DNA-binding transcriptional ArsR family regulator